MTAVEYEGKDRNELSDYVSNELINKLEESTALPLFQTRVFC